MRWSHGSPVEIGDLTENEPMRYVTAAGLRTSVIGLGTWQFGTREWGYGDTYARETAPALVRRALELGITMLDTAEGYGPGRSERIVGEALAAIPADGHDGLTVATKLMPIAPAEPVVAWQAAGSRHRLGVDALDLYYVHWPNPAVSPRRIGQALRPLLREGVVRRVGVSNHSVDQWQAVERGLRAPVVANQVRFSLVSPEPADDLVPYALAHDRLIVAYSPLGQGLLTGAGEDGSSVTGFRSRSPAFREVSRRRAEPLVHVVREIAGTHDATPAQVALAWVISHPNTIAIPGARTVEQLEQNAAAADLELAPHEIERLTAESEAYAAG